MISQKLFGVAYFNLQNEFIQKISESYVKSPEERRHRQAHQNHRQGVAYGLLARWPRDLLKFQARLLYEVKQFIQQVGFLDFLKGPRAL